MGIKRLGQGIIGVGGAIALGAISGSTQPANFRNLTLGGDVTSGSVMGSTGGATSLPAIVSNVDRDNHKCIGFADPTPDHLLVLKQPFSSLRLQVNSNGGDTTLVIAGPNQTIRCGDDSGSSKDAKIEDSDWQPGIYQIWVGTVEPNNSRDYRLSIRAK
jgi:hypothetical protein